MDTGNSNSLLPEDELHAALAEIERLPPEQVAAIPSLDDERAELERATAKRAAAPVEQVSAAERKTGPKEGAPVADNQDTPGDH